MKKSAVPTANHLAHGVHACHAICEIITNHIDEAIANNMDKIAKVSISVIDGSTYPFLDSQYRYIMSADNGAGIKDLYDVIKYGEAKGCRSSKDNHTFGMGYKIACAKISNSDYLFATQKEGTAWKGLKGTLDTKYQEEITLEGFDLPEYNTVFFTKLASGDEDVDADIEKELDILSSTISTKYFFYFKANKGLQVTYNGIPVFPVEFQLASDGFEQFHHDFSKEFGFRMDIYSYTAPGKEEGGTGTQIYDDSINGGGITLAYKHQTVCDDLGFFIIPNKAANKAFATALEQFRDQNGLKSDNEFLSTARPTCGWVNCYKKGKLAPKGKSHHGSLGLQKNRGKLNGTRIMIDIVPTRKKFFLDTTPDKSDFMPNDNFRNVLMAINYMVGDKARDLHASGTEAEHRRGTDLHTVNTMRNMSHQNQKFTYETEGHCKEGQTRLRTDGQILANGVPSAIYEYKKGTVCAHDIQQAFSYFDLIQEELLVKYPDLKIADRDIYFPNIIIYGENYNEEALRLVHIRFEKEKALCAYNYGKDNEGNIRHMFNVFLYTYSEESEDENVLFMEF